MSTSEKITEQVHLVTIVAIDDEGVDPQKLIELAKTALPSSHVISTACVGADAFDPTSDRDYYGLPLTRAEVRKHADDANAIALIVPVDQESYMRAHALGRQSPAAETHFEVLRRVAFDFPARIESETATIIGADPDTLLVHYSCQLTRL